MKWRFWKKKPRIDPNKILLVVKRTKPKPHYEVHFDKRVEFWALDGAKLGESKVEQVK